MMEARKDGDEMLSNGNGKAGDEDLKWSDEEDGKDVEMEEVEMEEVADLGGRKVARNELERKHNGHVRVISILGPYEFYVITRDGGELLKCLEFQLENHAKNRLKDLRTKRVHEKLKEEQNVIVKSNIFKKWCRGQVININLRKKHDLSNDLFCDKLSVESIRVHLIDYRFNEDEISIQKVCLGDEFFNFEKWPVRSIKCSLAGFKTDPRKTLEATELMKKYTLDKSVWFLFQTVVNEVTHISLTYQLCGVSVQHLGLKESLISAGFGSHDSKTDLFRVNFSPGHSYLEPTAPKVNDVFTGVVSHADSPDCFYINRASDKDVINDQQKAINDFFSDESNRNEFKLYHFILGMACIAAFSEDGMLYRAIVEGIDSLRRTCIVKYVDYGNKAQVPWSDIYLLPERFLRKEKMCIECRLGGVEPAIQHKWSQNAIHRFQQLLAMDRFQQQLAMDRFQQQLATDRFQKLSGDSPTWTDQHLAVKVLYRERGSRDLKIPVSLQRWEAGKSDPFDVGEELIKERAARPIHGNVSDSARLIMEMMSENISTMTIIRDICERHERAHSSLVERLIPVLVTVAKGPEEIWIRLEVPAVKRIFEHFMKELEREMEAGSCVKQEVDSLQADSLQVDSLQVDSLQVGKLCAFRITTPGSQSPSVWVRGKILSKSDRREDGQDVYILRAVDIGMEFAKVKSAIFTLPDKFVKHDPYAVKCSLFGIESCTRDGWSVTSRKKVVEFMQDPTWSKSLHLLVKEKIRANDGEEVIKCNIVGEERNVTLFSSEPIYHSLCDMMVQEFGVAIPVTRSSDYVTDSDILNDKNPVHSTEVSHRGVPDVQLNRDSLYSRIMQATCACDEVCRYPDPILPRSRTFEGRVTNVDEKFNIYFRLKENDSTIAAINRDISRQFVNGSLPSFNPPYTPGRGCTAKFSFDKSWNRATFLGFCHGNIANVYFVDYGNKDQLFLENLSQKVFAPQTPQLAIKCILHACRPFNEKVSTILHKEMYDLLVDKTCSFTWKNYPNLPMKVSISINESGQVIVAEKFLIQKDLVVETVEVQDLPPKVVTALEVLPRSDFPHKLLDEVETENSFIPVCFSAILGQNLIYIQLRGVEDSSDEQNKHLMHSTNRFLILQEKLQSFSKRQKPIGKKGRVGCACLAPYIDGDYYRAIILKEEESFDDVLTVYFVDYGNIEDVQPFRVVELPPSYADPPPPVQGLPAKLHNVRPRSGIWTSELVTKIGVHLSSQEHLIAKFSKVSTTSSQPGIPPTISSADLYLATKDNPLTPVTHALQRFVQTGELEYISEKQLLV